MIIGNQDDGSCIKDGVENGLAIKGSGEILEDKGQSFLENRHMNGLINVKTKL